MRTLIAALLAIVALPASAEEFRTQRTVTPPPLAEPAAVVLELSPAMQDEGGLRVVTETGFAIPFTTQVIARDLLPRATIARSPAAADTVPPTRVEMIRGNGAFQPVTARTHVFRFTFAEPVTPARVALDVESGRIDALRVRGGMTADAMSSLFAGPAYGGTRVDLSQERVRVVEVEIDTQGVLRIETLRILDLPTVLAFRAMPGKAYLLLSGGVDAAPVLFPGTSIGAIDPQRAAAVGPAQPAGQQGDHDAVADSADSCPLHWNRFQQDADKDGLGDACDPCPTVALGEDSDNDGRCDALEDPDKDGVATIRDNCPTVPNRLQEDEDADGIGNLCDDADDRFSTEKPWLLWAGIAVVVAALTGVVLLAARKRPGI